MRRRLASICLLALVALLAGACNLPKQANTGTNVAASATAAAQIVAALGTQLAAGTIPPPVSAITLTATQPAVSETPQTAATEQPSATPQPAATGAPAPQASQEVQVTGTVTQVPCNRAGLDGETIPDGTVMAPGQTFTKTWTLKNEGSCPWTTDFSVVFVSGVAMGAPASQPLSGPVAPGQSVQVSMTLQAPSTEGTYRGTFRLRNASGAIFSLGSAADKDFWVEVKVTSATGSIADTYCLGQWTTAEGALTCPGKIGDVKGYVVKVDAPKLENGTVDNEPAIVTGPPVGNGGQISGRLLPVTIANGAHFKTVVGCMYGANNCNVTFTLKYRVDRGAALTLGEWSEKADGGLTHVDVDLSSLAGKTVELILVVTANSSSDGQQAFWLNPKIS
jgi:hypothetical protein